MKKEADSNKIFDTCTPVQRKFYACDTFRKEKHLIRKLALKNKPEGYYSTPIPVKICCENGGFAELSENESFAECKKFTSENGEVKIYNLKKDTEYFYRTSSGETGSFRTDAVLPRWIYAKGYINIRDFGGEKTKDGKKIAQGMIFRGVKLENVKDSESGKASLLDLGIKTEIDLRKESMGKMSASPLGNKINYFLHPCNGYDDFLADNRLIIKYLFDYFADERLYPIYFHCHGGADRTGTVAFMLGAILGLDDATLIREYEMTMMANPEWKMSRSRKRKIKTFLEELQKMDETKTLQENAVDFLLKCGVSQIKMEKIKEILLKNTDV